MMNTIKLLGVLFLTCFIAAGSLAVINQLTKGPIAGWNARLQAGALAQVMPNAETFREVIPARQWDAVKSNNKIGTVFITETQGYSGSIKLVFAIDLENRITGLKVLSHTETPGLGAKITDAPWTDQFKGKSPGMVVLKAKGKSPGPGTPGIDAVTAATISSRAVVAEVGRTLKAYLDSQPQNGQGGA